MFKALLLMHVRVRINVEEQGVPQRGVEMTHG